MARKWQKTEESEKVKEEEKRKIIEPEEEKKEVQLEEVPERRKTREERLQEDRERELENWVPKTEIGRQVKEKKITDIDEILEKSKILEYQIVDKLLSLQNDLILIGQSKGKFGGGKARVWRQTQKKSSEGNVPHFGCMAIVGDMNGHIGLGYGKAKETLPAKEKALRDAKLNIFKVKRGCGSFDCVCSEQHSIPYKVEGKVGSSRIILMPAPKGTGWVIDDECKKIMKLVGIKDIYSRTFGQTRTKFNLIKACIEALKNISKIKT